MDITVTITLEEYNAIRFATATCGQEDLYPDPVTELFAMSGLYRMLRVAEPDETTFTELYGEIWKDAKEVYPNIEMAPR